MRMASFRRSMRTCKIRKLKKSLREQPTSAAAVGKPGGSSKQSSHLMQAYRNSAQPEVHIGKIRSIPTEIIILGPSSPRNTELTRLLSL